jgi:NitT/TauT family transport system permease protein
MAKVSDQITYETDDPNRIQDVGWTFREVWRRTRGFVVTSINLIIFFILWEIVTTYGNINSLFLPKASAMFQELWVGMTTRAPEGAVFSGSILDHFLHSFKNLMTGLAIACAIGIPGGLLMGGNKYVESILSPYVWALASLPRIALVPLFILFLGFTTTMQVTIIVLSAVFPIIINAWAGVKTTEKSLLAAAKVFGANRTQLYYKVVIAELFGGSNGLGYLIQRSADTFNTAMTFAVLLLLIVMSLSLINFTRWLEAKVAPWRNVNHL